MQTDASPDASFEDQPDAKTFADVHADMRVALQQWLGVLDRVLKEDLDPAKRAELLKATEQLKEIVHSMFGPSPETQAD